MHDATAPYPTPDPADPTKGYTAARTDKGSKPFVTLYLDGQPIGQMGGNRAGRATACLVVAYGPEHGRREGASEAWGMHYAGKSQWLGLRAALGGVRQVDRILYGRREQFVEFHVPVTPQV